VEQRRTVESATLTLSLPLSLPLHLSQSLPLNLPLESVLLLPNDSARDRDR
jgi:hypothetical protein